MATIRKRRKKDGSFSYMVQIRIARRGQPDHAETKTFPRKAMAEEWAKRRELELASPGGVLTAKWKGVTLNDAIERYLHEFAEGAGRSKRATIEQLQRFPIARVKITELSSEQIIDHAQMRRRSGVMASTTSQDITWIGIILKTAVAAWRMPVDLNEFESAKLLLRSKGLISRPGSRDRRPTVEEIEKLRAYFVRSQKIRPSAIIPMEDIMDFAIASARRQAEITRLTWDDLDTEAMTCWVRDAKHPRQKWGNHKRFKLTHEAMAIIQRQPRIQGEPRIFPYGPKSIGTRWRAATIAKRIDDLRFHDLRHEGTSRLFEAGYEIVEVQQFTLHESWDVLKRYTHLRPEKLKLR
ncbi:Phage integrase family protein [Vreelandella subterranea]|uniref:Phage integrase family protein n=1 Tax=Vreelandella subterranea TaxID=416874 RepID=A0A1H9WFH1_9GAMM|nr:site-specific integrase [Halomonas subterranea]SES32668.1 Phage integrase family protein [Halomonas subterranea]